MTVSQSVRQRLRNHLDALPSRPTQSAIGDALDRTQTWVSHYFSGRHDIDLDTLSNLCEFLHVDIRSLFESDDRQTLPAPYAEALTLLKSIAPAERDLIIDLLRQMARRPTKKRARK